MTAFSVVFIAVAVAVGCSSSSPAAIDAQTWSSGIKGETALRNPR